MQKQVSLLNRECVPAYDGTLVMVRADEEKAQMRAEVFADEIELIDETEQENPEESETPKERSESEEDKTPPKDKEIDYSKYEQMIAEMKGEKS